jgi:hypothetical protein
MITLIDIFICEKLSDFRLNEWSADGPFPLFPVEQGHVPLVPTVPSAFPT